MHDVFMGDITIGEKDLINVQLRDEFVELSLRLDRYSFGIKRSGQFCGIFYRYL